MTDDRQLAGLGLHDPGPDRARSRSARTRDPPIRYDVNCAKNDAPDLNGSGGDARGPDAGGEPVRHAIKRYSRDFVAIIVLALIGLATLFVILSQQASALPSWFPILGEDSFQLKAEFETAQAVTPGQGQSVNMAGVKIGDVSGVELEDGLAVVSLDVEPEYAELIHEDASALLRPRTGLQDMTVEVDPGTENTDPIEENATISVGRDEAERQRRSDPRLARRRHPGLPEAAARRRRRGARPTAAIASSRWSCAGSSRPCATSPRSTAPSPSGARTCAAVITNFGLIAKRLAANDVPLADFVSSQNEVFGAFANQEANLRATLRGFPGALEETRLALDAGDKLSGELKPALEELIPAAQALKPALEELQPFFRTTEPSVRNQIRPFTKEVAPVVKELKKAAPPLASSSKGLEGTFTELSSLLDGLAYNPPGPDEGYLFYLSWLNHNGNSALLLEDAEGPMARSVLMYSCNLSTSPTTPSSIPPRPAHGPPDDSASPTPPISATERAPRWKPAHRQPERSSSRSASRSRASACCCSSGSPSAARCRSSRRATG